MKSFLVHMRASRARGFTLVEVLVSSALLVGIMALLLSTVEQTQKLWSRTRSKTSQFQSARNAFEAMARRMSQATLNTYWKAYEESVGTERADYFYRRQGEFQFLSGKASRIFEAPPALRSLNEPADECYPTHAVFFHAPLGYTEQVDTVGGQVLKRFRALDSLMAASGYFIEYGPDTDRPDFVANLTPPQPDRYRYRLMELTVPAERFNIYYRPSDNSRLLSDPRVFDENTPPSSSGTSTPSYYQGLVDKNRQSVSSYVRPLWMKESLTRDPVVSTNGAARFRYARPMAENIVALIILPKLAERDRGTATGGAPNPKVLELAPNYEYDSWRVLTGGDAQAPGISGATGKLDNRARDNLLPPIVQLTMVAIDEPSAQQMNLSKTNHPNWTTSLFTSVSRVDDYDADMKRLIQNIQQDPKFPHANFRVFSTDVVIRGSKWSRDPR